MALQPGQRPPRGVAEVRPSCPNQRRKMITIRITRAVIEFTSTAGRGDESGLAVKALLPVLEGRLQRKPGRLPALPADHGRKRRKAPLMKKTTEATMSPSPSDRRPAPAATVVNRSTRQRNPQSLRPKDGPAMQSLNAITIVGLRVRGRCVRSLSLSLCPPPPPPPPRLCSLSKWREPVGGKSSGRGSSHPLHLPDQHSQATRAQMHPRTSASCAATRRCDLCHESAK